MRKIVKYILIVSLIIFLFFLVDILVFLSFGLRIYQGRYRECDPNELIPVVHKVFGIDFPQNIRDVKAAKTPVQDRSVLFILKFTSEPNDINNLVNSDMIALGPQICEKRCNFSDLWWFRPSWMSKGISQGIKYIIRSLPEEISASGDLCIDTTDKNNFVVYIVGLYEATNQ